jgi:hypothetical protein
MASEADMTKPMQISALTGLVVLGLATTAAAQRPVEFWRVRAGSRVAIVLDAGGECRGTVARRIAGALEITLSEASPSCGPRHGMVVVQESNTRAVETAEMQLKDTTDKRIGAVAVAAGAGLLAPRLGRSALGVLLGAAAALRFLNRDIDRPEREKTAYVLYVSRLGAEMSQARVPDAGPLNPVRD